MDTEQVQQEAGASRVWLPGITQCIARCLPANEVACTLRLLDKATSWQLDDFKTVRLSLPSPPEAYKQRWGSWDAFRSLPWKRRLQVLCLTAASGSIANLEVALGSSGLLATPKLMEAAAEAGQLEACRFLRERGCCWGRGLVLAAAARGGHRHVCEWLLASGCPWPGSLPVLGAARSGHEGLMHWLLQRFREDSRADVDAGELLTAAAAGLSLAALQRLHQQHLLQAEQQQPQLPQQPLNEEQQCSVVASAAGSSTPDWRAKVQWLEGLGYPRAAVACFAAARSPDDAAGRLQWLHSRGYPLDAQVAELAACGDDLLALRFLMEQLSLRPAGRASSREAATSPPGRLAVLQYLHASGGFPMDAPAVAGEAAGRGDLAAVAWAVEALAGVTPGSARDLLNLAARAGSLELMSWLRERGWRWAGDAIHTAVECGCEELLEWLVVAQGYRWPPGEYAYLCAARQSDLATVHCLRRLGCPWGSELLWYCIASDVAVPMLRHLVELGCPADWESAVMGTEQLIPHGEYRTALLEWLAEQPWRQQQQQRGFSAAAVAVVAPPFSGSSSSRNSDS